jgi:predicted membrane-bound spermidine synthase
VAWLRELRLVFGSTTAASAAVVAIFMGGLGIGNAILGKRADLKRNPLAFYAVLEGSIAVTAGLSPWLIDAVRWVYIQLGGQTVLGGTVATAIRLVLSALVLLLPTVLMGGTLPAAIAAVTTAKDEHRRAPAILYGVNTLGAVAGAMASTFVLLLALGTRMTLWSACVLNVAVAAGAYVLSRGGTEPRTEPVALAKSSQTARRQEKGGQAPFVRSTLRAVPANGDCPPFSVNPVHVYASAGIVGFAFMLMELVWYRMLAPILGGTTFTFGLILSVALLGIGLGGALYPVIFRRRQPDLWALSATCGLEAISIALPFALGDRLAVAAAILHETNSYAFLGEVVGWSAIAAAVVLPASIVSGVQFPILIALLGRGDKNVGQQVGWTYAFNTLGCIVGSLAGGLGLLPLLSAPGSWRLVVVTVAALSVCLALIAGRRESSRRPALVHIGLGTIAVLLLAFSGPTAVWRHSGIGAGRAELPATRTANAMHSWKNGKLRGILWEVDGIEAGVGIVSRNDLVFVVNGKSDGSAIIDAGTQTCLGLLGAILHPDPKTCLVVGLGTGETAGWLAKVRSVQRVDVVEIEPAVVEMARRCAAVNEQVLDNPKVNIIYNDAREVLLTNPKSYDVVASEPSNPYRAGVANLYTQEFYSAVRGRLNEGGLFVQFMQTYETDAMTVGTVLATLKSVFKHAEIWQSKDHDAILICSEKPLAYGSEMLRRRVGEEPYRTAFASAWHTSRIEGLLTRFVGGEKWVENMIHARSYPLNTDDHNHVEYGYARTLGRPSRVSLAGLHQQALEAGAGHPSNRIEGVDWESVEDERLAMSTLVSRVESSPERDPQRAARRRAFLRWQARDFAAVVSQWESQSRQPVLPTETALLAFAYAQIGNAKAEALIERLRSHNPREAALILGILRVRQGRRREATEALVRGFTDMRTDPWVLLPVIQRAVLAACEVVQKEPVYAPELLDSLKEPFPVTYADDVRRGAGCFIASTISPQAAVPWLESFEPHVPWDHAFLEARANTYKATGHPLAARAAADVELFVSNEKTNP